MDEVLSISEIFGRNIFNGAAMKGRLPKNVYEKLKKTTENGAGLGPSIAGITAHAMRNRTTERGATHYAHWFQPLTDATAGKRDSLISTPNGGRVVMELSDKELVRGKPDVSSSPSGGLRTTFEARGYTVQNRSSPAFLRESAIGMALCISAPLRSYRGESLDRKIPLLRSIQTVNGQVLRVLRLFSNTTAKRVASSVGIKQKYFLVDRERYLQHEDLIYIGRTLFGAVLPKKQELEDHYFGAIRERIGSYINNVNKELWKLEVSTKTRHNEVASAQHELIPICEGANQAMDHNQIVMGALEKVAGRHGTAYLFHKRPLADVNGSSKHNSWLLTIDSGTSLLNSGGTPHENIQFLLALAYVIRTVSVHADLLKELAADVESDHRLGTNEMPPATISIFLGEQSENVINQLCNTGEAAHSEEGGTPRTGVDILPDLDKDTAGRNRTSSFTLIGNEFKFRMTGPLDSIASPDVVLNTIVAEAFKGAADKLEKADDPDMAVHGLIREALPTHRRITFNGNGYADEWVVEAEQRGLPNIRSMVDAIPVLIANKTVKLSEKFCIFIGAELESGAEVEYEGYSKTINIEARTMYDMTSRSITLAVVKCVTDPAVSVIIVRSACPDVDVGTQTGPLLKVLDLLGKTETTLSRLAEMTERTAITEGGETQTLVYHQDVVPAMVTLRTPVDQLEVIMNEGLRPVPNYGDLTFEI